MHNLGTIFSFEVIRALKKKSFWLVSVLFPIAIASVLGIIYLSNQATNKAAEDSSRQAFSFEILDESGDVSPRLVAAAKGGVAASRDQGIRRVESGKIDAFFYYPKDITRDPVRVYAKDVGLFDNARYSTVAKSLLGQSVSAKVSPNTTAILAGQTKVESVTYRDGQPYDGLRELIAPAAFLVLFYLMIATFGNQMLNSTTEEKENRVIEMILTTVETRTMIFGKILSLIVLGFVQMVIVMVPIAVAYLLLHDRLALPGLDASYLVFDWPRIGIGFLLFTASFILFTGLLVAIGAAAPTAKEAGSFFGVAMVLIFGPLYALPLFVSSPESSIVQFLSYFPFTAPLPLMIRNAVGNLELWQAGVALMVLLLTAGIVLWLGVRAFRYGALEYSRRLTLKEFFGRR